MPIAGSHDTLDIVAGADIQADITKEIQILSDWYDAVVCLEVLEHTVVDPVGGSA